MHNLEEQTNANLLLEDQQKKRHSKCFKIFMQDRWRRKFDDVTLKWKMYDFCGQNKSVFNRFFITSFT